MRIVTRSVISAGTTFGTAEGRSPTTEAQAGQSTEFCRRNLLGAPGRSVTTGVALHAQQLVRSIICALSNLRASPLRDQPWLGACTQTVIWWRPGQTALLG
jgi:hypothetical protein